MSARLTTKQMARLCPQLIPRPGWHGPAHKGHRECMRAAKRFEALWRKGSVMRILACGHGHYDKGHCGQPDCGNDFRKCPECSQESRQGKGWPGNPGRTPADAPSSQADPRPSRWRAS